MIGTNDSELMCSGQPLKTVYGIGIRDVGNGRMSAAENCFCGMFR